MTRGMKVSPGRAIIALLIAGLVAIKALSLLLDPTVRLFMGDSASYLHSAYADWIPQDRSYTYPLFIRLVAVPFQSLTPLLLAQSFLGICTALLLFRMLQRAFGVDDRIAATAALVFTLGPEQLLYERMVMAEAIGLFALASMLACGLEYLRKGNVAWLAGMVLAGCLAISYRLSLLPVVLGFALLPPLVRACAQRPWSWRRHGVTLGHLALAAVMTVAAHSAYKSWNGYLSDSKPGYAANAGMLRLGLVLPLVEAEDLDGVGLPPDFLASLPPGWNDPDAREAALWAEDGMIARMREELGDEGMARAARKISIRALRRDPSALPRLSWQTLGGYFDASRRPPSHERRSRRTCSRCRGGQDPAAALQLRRNRDCGTTHAGVPLLCGGGTLVDGLPVRPAAAGPGHPGDGLEDAARRHAPARADLTRPVPRPRPVLEHRFVPLPARISVVLLAQRRGHRRLDTPLPLRDARAGRSRTSMTGS